MKRSTMILNGSSAVIFQVALTAWMFCLSSINFDFEALGLSFLHICAVPLILYYINFFLLERTVPIPVYIVTQLAFLALGIFLFIKTTVIDPLVLRTMIINGIIYATAFITAAFVAWDPVHTTGLLLRFDFLAIMMILLLLLDNIRVLPAFSSTAAMCGSALVFTLLTIMADKAGTVRQGASVQGSSSVGKLLMSGAFGTIICFAAVVTVFVSGKFKSVSEFLIKVVTWIFETVKSALLFAWKLIESILFRLSKFFEPDYSAVIGTGENTMAVPDQDLGAEFKLPSFIYVVIMAIAAAMIIFIIFKLRHLKVGKLSRKAVIIQPSKRSGGLKKELSAILKNLKAAVIFRFNKFRYRKTAPALLIYCEKISKSKLKRGIGESGESFLRRMALICDDKQLCSALEKLSKLVEHSFYSPKPVVVDDDIYKVIKQAKF